MCAPSSVFCVLFVCKCVLYYCHWVSTRLQLNNNNNNNNNNNKMYRQSCPCTRHECISGEVSGQPSASAALPWWKAPLIPILHEPAWAPQPVGRSTEEELLPLSGSESGSYSSQHSCRTDYATPATKTDFITKMFLSLLF
jgi:hypothetical protein